MGSLSPQGSDPSITIENIDDENITVTTTYTNVLEIDSDNISDSVITLYNTDTTDSLTYKIYATSKNTTTIPVDGDDSWINIIRDLAVDDSIPANYDHDREKTLPALIRSYESFSNKWKWVRVQMKTTTGTLIAKAWHRGTTT